MVRHTEVFLIKFGVLLGERLHQAPGAVHRHQHPVSQETGGVPGVDDDRLVEDETHGGRVAVGADLLADDGSGLAELG